MSSSRPETFPTKQRFGIIDATKGVAIILVAFGHTAQGGMHRHLWDEMPGVVRGIQFALAFIYSFHMPAFFFVAGLFLCRSVERRGRLNFVLEKSRTLLYPYILWGLLTFLLDPITAGFRIIGVPPSWQSHVSGILTGNASWFLITLFLSQLLTLLILRFPQGIQMFIALASCVLIPTSNVTILYKPFQFLPFLVAGMWFSQNRIRNLEGLSKGFAWIGFVLLLTVQLTAVAVWGPVSRWTLAPFGLIGIGMLLFLCLAIRNSVSERILIWIGEASLGIFLLSPFFQGLGREFVTRVLHATNPLFYLGLTTLCSAALPAVLWFSQDKLHIGWLFRWPARTNRLLPSTPQAVAR
jgi:fucose 4-O-acetylase-like acetyltransferase